MPKIPKVVLMVGPVGEYIQGILRGVVKYANQHGPWTFYCEPKRPGQQDRILPQLDCSEADGIIARIPNNKRARSRLPSGIPTITIAHKKRIMDLPNIYGDSYAIGEMAAEYLLSRGFQKYAFCGFDEMHWSQERGQSFAASVSRYGYEVYFYHNPKASQRQNPEDEQPQIISWLESLPKPMAILACNDDRGQHVLSACQVAGIRVPEEVAVLGVDNDQFVCGLSNPPLSSIGLAAEKAGFDAAHLLANLINGSETGYKTIKVLPTYVVTRQSTDILKVEDDDLAAALNFISKHAKEPIQVEDIINSLGISRRSLERRFKKILNTTVNDEIRRVRVKHITKMLLETDLTIAQIGLAFGYRDITHIARYFRQETGMTPLAYRKKYSHEYAQNN